MKIIFQITLFLCFSFSMFAQEISCNQLMKLPLGKYLYDSNSDSVLFVMNNLERCGFESFEVEHSIISIFISNIVGEKGGAATVQDLYDEVLIFRRQNNAEEIKHDLVKKEIFYKKYNTKTITTENWANGKSLLVDVFAFDETDLETYKITLSNNNSTITYETFLTDFEIYLKEKYHLSKVAKSNPTDFDFNTNRTINEFPLMDYFERKKDVTGKLTLVYFYGHGVINCTKLNESSFYNPKLCKLIEQEFNLITLCIDSSVKLPEALQEKWQKYAPEKPLSSVGSYNSFIQKQIAFTDRQPYFVVLDDFGHILLEIDYEKAKNPKMFVESLEKVLKK